MYKYSENSEKRLITCEDDLQVLFRTVLKYIDHSIYEGYRNEEKQNQYYAEGASKLKFPNGNHNKHPSQAIDVCPYPRPSPNENRRYYYFAGFVLGIASLLKKEGVLTHDIRWGGDWNMNNRFDDQTFNDLVHFELV